jgi:hypothetical protein
MNAETVETKVLSWGRLGLVVIDPSVSLPTEKVPVFRAGNIANEPWAWAQLEARPDGLWMKTPSPVPDGWHVAPVFMMGDGARVAKVDSLLITTMPSTVTAAP